MIDTDKAPQPYGLLWTIAENLGKRGMVDWNKKKYAEALFFHPLQEEVTINGENLLKYFREKHTPVLNAIIWEYLRDNPKEIPDEWKINQKGEVQYIFFWGTIDRSPQGNLYVRYITWTGGNWTASNYLLSGDWHGDFPAAVFVK